MPRLIYSFHWYFSKAREHPGIHRKLHDLRNEGKSTPQEWQKLQVKRLRSLLAFAKNHVPYYSQTFERVGFHPKTAELPRDLARIPVLTKELVRQNPNDLIADNVNKSHLLENATGGSTGVPLKFYQDREYQTTAAAIDAYVRESWEIKPYDKTALIWGADREFHELSLRERLYEWRSRVRSLNAFRMNEERLLQFCRMLTRWQPPHLMGYSSALEALAQCARKNGIMNLQFKAIRSTAETLWPHQKKLIEETFKTPVYNFYGSREVNNLVAECPESRNMHMISTWRYLEIVDGKGRRLPDGETGYIAVTDLSNRAMPFIRYLNEDIGRIAKSLCSCGRPSPILEELVGRSTDLIRTARGDIVHGEFFTHLFYGRNDIRQFQVHQTALDHLVVRYVPIGNPSEDFFKEVVQKINERLGKGITIDMEACKEIPVPSSGKHRFTISDV